jgi:hypothetical protein
MAEWWSYQPSDFLLFSARTYQRLFEVYNAEIWPAHVFATALGVALFACMVAMQRGSTVAAVVAARTACVLVAAGWLWIAWAFHLQRYAAINWVATWFAAAFAAQGVLFFALFIQPWATLALTGRPWREVEVFGLAPDSTAIGTLGLLLVLRPPSGARALAFLLWPIPLLWCLVGALTRWTLAAQGG